MNSVVRLGAVAFALLGCACVNPEVSTSPPAADIAIVRLRPEPYSFTFVSGFDKPARLVIRDAANWEAVWAETFKNGSAPPIPAIEFSREMVVLVALGSHPSGGYGILIDGAAETGTNTVAVTVRSISPGPKCAVTQAFTQPVDIARLPRRDGVVRFVERSELTACE